MCCVLGVVRYSLCVCRCLFVVVGCWLCVVVAGGGCSLFVVCRTMFVVVCRVGFDGCHLLYVVRWLVFVVGSLLLVMCCLLLCVDCTSLLVARCSLLVVRCCALFAGRCLYFVVYRRLLPC